MVDGEENKPKRYHKGRKAEQNLDKKHGINFKVTLHRVFLEVKIREEK